MRRTWGVSFLVLILLLQRSPSFGSDTQIPSSEATLIDTVNFYRVASGLKPITEDKRLSVAVIKHIRYLTLSDPKYFTGKYVSRHLENPASPYYTMEGSHSGQELTSTLTNDQSQSVDRWMSAPFHAIGLMREGLFEIGWASAYNPQTGFYDTGADVLDRLKLRRTKIITFPGNGSYSRMDNFQGESPDPREACGSNYQSFTGLPIWVSLLAKPPHQMSAQLVTPSGVVVSSRDQLCIVNELTMKSSDPLYGPAGRAIVRSDHMVLIFPKDPLTPGLQKVSLFILGQQEISWSFTVIASPPTIVISSLNSQAEISWSAPPSQAGNPTLGYDVVVGDADLKKFQIFRTASTTFPTSRIGPGNHWLCVKTIARYRSGECPNFTSYTVNQEDADHTSVSPIRS